MTEIIVKAEGLTKRYGRGTAVDRVSLEIQSGCVFALIGRNGAGKSSLIRMLLGLTTITEGWASVFGLDADRDHVQIRQRAGYVPETHQIYRWMKIWELMRFTSAFYPSWDPDLCDDLLNKFGLDPRKQISELSRGMLAKVALVLALAHRPEALFMDEPTSGLDAAVRKEFLESIVGVAAEEGRTVLISSHRLDDVERIADRVAILADGKIRLVEDLETLKANVHEFRLTFSQDPPESFDMPRMVSLRKSGREWILVVSGSEAETLSRLQTALPHAAIASQAMTLEEIFLAMA